MGHTLRKIMYNVDGSGSKIVGGKERQRQRRLLAKTVLANPVVSCASTIFQQDQGKTMAGRDGTQEDSPWIPGVPTPISPVGPADHSGGMVDNTSFFAVIGVAAVMGLITLFLALYLLPRVCCPLKYAAFCSRKPLQRMLNAMDKDQTDWENQKMHVDYMTTVLGMDSKNKEVVAETNKLSKLEKKRNETAKEIRGTLTIEFKAWTTKMEKMNQAGDGDKQKNEAERAKFLRKGREMQYILDFVTPNEHGEYVAP